MKRILDSDFVYVNSVNTSVARTFARIRKELKAATGAEKLSEGTGTVESRPIKPVPVAAPVRLLRKAGR